MVRYHWMAFDRETGEVVHEGDVYQVAAALGVKPNTVRLAFYNGRTCGGCDIDNKKPDPPPVDADAQERKRQRRLEQKRAYGKAYYARKKAEKERSAKL